ncbi:MAG: VWA domain-containing protein [Akkermansiaceae bacterium]
MKSKLTNNDPRLTAYALGELPRDEAEEVSRLLAANENRPLKREVASIDSLGVMLSNTLNSGAGDSLKLSASQRDAIFRSAKAPTADDVSSAHQSAWLRPVLVTLGAAALVTISFMVLDNVDSSEDMLTRMPEVSFSELTEDKLNAPIQPSAANWEGEAGSSSVSSQGAVDVSYPLADEGGGIEDDKGQLINLVEHDWVNRADQAVTRMPMACGKASWKWVKHSIEVDGVLPDKNAVRVEEVLNAFQYDEPSDLELSFVTAGVELVECPWNDEKLIAVILVKNKHEQITQIETAVTFSESVGRYRLVGYAKAESGNENIIAPAKITMAAGSAQIVMYEIETTGDLEDAVDILSLNLRTSSLQGEEWVNDDKTLKVQYSDRSWTKAEQDVQFALTLASWSQVISGSSYTAEMGKEGVVEMISYFDSLHDLTVEQSEAIDTMKKGLEIR